MKLRIDDRIGSVELAPLFQPYGITPLVCRLEYGDLDFHGQGPFGDCVIAIERKRINDLVSSIQSKRLSGHQLPGMVAQYDYCYLVVEGSWRCGSSGQLEILDRRGWNQSFSGQFLYRQIDNYLSTLEVVTGVIFRRTYDDRETVAVVVDLMRWWEKPWESHHSHDVKYQPADGVEGRRLRLIAPTPVELVARTLPGIDRKARRVSKAFPTIAAMVAATSDDWQQIEGIGPVMAAKILETIHGPQK